MSREAASCRTVYNSPSSPFLSYCPGSAVHTSVRVHMYIFSVSTGCAVIRRSRVGFCTSKRQMRVHPAPTLFAIHGRLCLPRILHLEISFPQSLRCKRNNERTFQWTNPSTIHSTLFRNKNATFKGPERFHLAHRLRQASIGSEHYRAIVASQKHTNSTAKG